MTTDLGPPNIALFGMELSQCIIYTGSVEERKMVDNSVIFYQANSPLSILQQM